MPGPGGMRGQQFLTEEEKANAPKVTKELLLRILGYLKPYWLQFLMVFVAILVSSVVGLLPSIITGRIVDQALVGNDLALLVRLLLTALAAMLASQLVGVLENYINSWISQRIIFDMKNEMYHHLQHMPHAFFTTEKQGDIVTRMNTDISGVSSVISGTLTQVVSNVATVVTTLVALFSMSPKLAVVGLLVLPLLILPTRSAGRVRLKLVQESQAKNDEMNQLINETLSVSGSLLMKMFTREEREYERFVGVNEEVTALSLKEQRSGSWFRVVMGMFTQLGPLLIYFAGGLLIIRQLDPTLTVGTVTATVTLVNRLYRPVESLLNLQVSFTRSLAMFTRIFDYLDRKSTIVSPENGAKPDCEMAEIVYDHVAFGYDDTDDLVLTDVSFTVPGGKMYAIVGPSGSGKSTVVNLIPRLYDVKRGSVRVAGVDVRDFDLTYLRECVGVVTQEAYLFNGTILDNLRYANARRHHGGDRGGLPHRQHPRLHREPARRLRHRGGQPRPQALGRREAAPVARARGAQGPQDPHPRRGHERARLHLRERHPGGARAADGGAHEHRHRAPPLDHPQGRPHPGGEGRRHRRAGHARGAAGRGRRVPRAVRDAVPPGHRARAGTAPRLASTCRRSPPPSTCAHSTARTCPRCSPSPAPTASTTATWANVRPRPISPHSSRVCPKARSPKASTSSASLTTRATSWRSWT